MNEKWNYSDVEWEEFLRKEEKESDKSIGKVIDFFIALIVVGILILR